MALRAAQRGAGFPAGRVGLRADVFLGPRLQRPRTVTLFTGPRSPSGAGALSGYTGLTVLLHDGAGPLRQRRPAALPRAQRANRLTNAVVVHLPNIRRTYGALGE